LAICWCLTVVSHFPPTFFDGPNADALGRGYMLVPDRG
jgi:hypothetical protein